MTAKVERWPVAIRLIHWLLALALVLNLFVLEEGDPSHRYLGYTASALVVARLLWGFFGRGPAAFSNYARSLQNAVYFFIWTNVLAMGVTGFMMGLDAFWGDERLEDIHSVLSKVLMCFVALHLAGVGLDALRYRRATWMAMIDGRR